MNMNKMLQQAQKMQKDMENTQKNINETIYTEKFQDLIEIEAYGNKQIKNIKLEKDIVDSEDIEMLEDSIVSTINKLFKLIDQDTEIKMSKFSKGMGGGFPF